MKISLASVLTLLTVTVSGSPAVLDTGVKAPEPDTPPSIIFCVPGAGCTYPAMTITPGACVNFNDYLANIVQQVIVPNGYVCTVFLIPGCSDIGHSFFGQLDPVAQDVPGQFYEKTGSYRCSPW